MPPLPIISGQDCIDALAKLGYRKLRQRGSHVRLVCVGRAPATIPLHGTLDRGAGLPHIYGHNVAVRDLIAKHRKAKAS